MSESKNSKHRKLPKPQDLESPNSECEPERKLLCAIIQMAIVDACGHVVSGVDEIVARYKARKWILDSNIKLKSPFSYGWICQELELCPYRIRQFVLDSIANKTEYQRVTSRIYGLRGTGNHTTKTKRKIH